MMSRDRAAARFVELLDGPFLRAVTEPARLAIVRALLVAGPSDVGAIAAELPQHRSVISRHLQTLEAAGIVRGERDGRRHVYALDGAAFMAELERLLAEARILVAACCPPAPMVPVTRLRRRR